MEISRSSSQAAFFSDGAKETELNFRNNVSLTQICQTETLIGNKKIYQNIFFLARTADKITDGGTTFPYHQGLCGQIHLHIVHYILDILHNNKLRETYFVMT